MPQSPTSANPGDPDFQANAGVHAGWVDAGTPWLDPFTLAGLGPYEDEPGQTRDILGLCLAIVTSVPEFHRRTPVYRM